MYKAYKEEASKMSLNRVCVSVEQFGVLENGTPVKMFKLRDGKTGYEARFIELGAALQALYVPDAHGRFEDVVLGFDTVEQYEKHNKAFQGVIIGRVAGRIKEGKFTLDGVPYQVSQNDKGLHHLHGGFNGIYKLLWKGTVVHTANGAAVQFDCVSPHMHEGFPGEAKFRVTYSLLPDSAADHKCTLRMQIQAEVDRACPISPDTHVLFNLNGEANASHATVSNHLFHIPLNRVGNQGPDVVPTGFYDDVSGPLDFRTPRRGLLIDSDSFVGYAHSYENYSVNSSEERAQGVRKRELQEVASAFVPENGRRLVVRTDAPTTVFYAGSGLGGTPGKRGKLYSKFSGFLFICEHSPNAVNLQNHAGFSDPILRPGRRFERQIDYEFSVASPVKN